MSIASGSVIKASEINAHSSRNYATVYGSDNWSMSMVTLWSGYIAYTGSDAVQVVATATALLSAAMVDIYFNGTKVDSKSTPLDGISTWTWGYGAGLYRIDGGGANVASCNHFVVNVKRSPLVTAGHHIGKLKSDYSGIDTSARGTKIYASDIALLCNAD